jgi:glycosyltransferase involved in cell wall biosynthesis|tara:strand:- start:952 stop:1635 length:684 start_codon:yes stop_codon:yes gene_type:complete
MVKKLSNISVIIRCKNEENWIGHAIQSVLDNLIKPEIIIIDNGSTDKTLDIVKMFVEDPLLQNDSKNYTKIKIFKIRDYTPGKSLNLGVSKSTKKFIMFLSAHCVLKKFDENEIIKKLKNFACLFGKQTPVWFGKKITKRYLWSHFDDEQKINYFSNLENRYFLHNALAIYNKNILKKFPFDPYLSTKEDRYWAKKIVSKKLKFLYYPLLEADHHYTVGGNTWKGLG